MRKLAEPMRALRATLTFVSICTIDSGTSHIHVKVGLEVAGGVILHVNVSKVSKPQLLHLMRFPLCPRNINHHHAYHAKEAARRR